MLPGQDLVERGIADLKSGVESAEAYLVALFAPRLQRLGIALPSPLPSDPKQRLYRHLGADGGPSDTHARMNALIRRLTSYARALEAEHYRAG